jgi:nitrite reductase/ring-hydroxylating ferredoxin subunit
VTPYQRPADSVLIRRRTVIMNAGLAVAAVAGLSSCTTYGTTPATEPSAPPSGAGGSAQGLTAKTADIPVGSGKIFAEAQTVITQPKHGEFKAFSAVCTHQSCLVDAVTNTINCPCHGSKYSITDGSVVNPPATQPLPPKTIKVSGDNLSVS